MVAQIPINRDAIAAFCQRYRIRKLSLFGSVLRSDFDLGRSDVDVLIEFEQGADDGITYFDLARMRFELEDIFNRSVDLSMADALDAYFRDEILATAEVQYDAA